MILSGIAASKESSLSVGKSVPGSHPSTMSRSIVVLSSIKDAIVDKIEVLQRGLVSGDATFGREEFVQPKESGFIQNPATFVANVSEVLEEHESSFCMKTNLSMTWVQFYLGVFIEAVMMKFLDTCLNFLKASLVEVYHSDAFYAKCFDNSKVIDDQTIDMLTMFKSKLKIGEDNAVDLSWYITSLESRTKEGPYQLKDLGHTLWVHFWDLQTRIVTRTATLLEGRTVVSTGLLVEKPLSLYEDVRKAFEILGKSHKFIKTWSSIRDGIG